MNQIKKISKFCQFFTMLLRHKPLKNLKLMHKTTWAKGEEELKTTGQLNDCFLGKTSLLKNGPLKNFQMTMMIMIMMIMIMIMIFILLLSYECYFYNENDQLWQIINLTKHVKITASCTKLKQPLWSVKC